MKTIFIISLQLSIFLSTFSVFAADSLYSHKSARVEIGAGHGFVGEGGGFSGRIAITYLHSNWGGVIRFSAHDGGEGRGGSGGLFRFGPPIEKFYDNSILLSYVIQDSKSVQVVGSAGIGSLYGERLTDRKTELEEFGRIIGIAYELGIGSAGSTLGYWINIMGNVNSESNLFAFFLSITFGYQK